MEDGECAERERRSDEEQPAGRRGEVPEVALLVGPRGLRRAHCSLLSSWWVRPGSVADGGGVLTTGSG